MYVLTVILMCLFAVMQSLIVGIAKHRPADKLQYLQQCLDTVARIGWQHVELNTFLNDANDLSPSPKLTGWTSLYYIHILIHQKNGSRSRE